MKPNLIRRNSSPRLLSRLALTALCSLVLTTAHAQPIKWGLTLTNINNPIPTTVVTNGDGSISITAGGGDTYADPLQPYSFAYAYQQVTGDFDIRVRVLGVEVTDPLAPGADSAKGALMVRTTLDPVLSADFQINATPLAPAGRDGEIECIGRMRPDGTTDDLPGRMQKYGGDSTVAGYATYPDCWLRIQRSGEKLMSYFATTNTTDFPGGYSPGSTNGWQLMCVIHAGTNFPKTLYVGLSTVAHNGDINNAVQKVTSTYDSYGSTPTPPSTPSASGVAVAAGNAPGPFPNQKVLAANFDAALPADGLGYPGDIVQSAQGSPSQIIWNSGGFGSVSRDIIASISGQTPGGFSFGRYQAGAFDFLISPLDPVAAQQNLGPYSNPLRKRIATGDITTPPTQAYAPSPNYGFVFSTVHKNGQQWNDTSPYFYAATYVQLDGSATGQGYDMIGGHYRGAQFYTRTTKLVTGTPTDPASSLSNLQRCAIPISVGWFPYDQGWKAGYFEAVDTAATSSKSFWKRGDGWGLNSGNALSGIPIGVRQSEYNNPGTLLEWQDLGGFYGGLAKLSLPGVNSQNDGMLFTISNEEGGSLRGNYANNAALADGSGWDVAIRGIEESKADPTLYVTDNRSSFSFLFVPFNADNLIGGRVDGIEGIPMKSAGTFTLQKIAAGRYALTIPGKTGADGALFLQNSGYLPQTNVVDTAFLSYEYGGTNTPANAFIIESRKIDPAANGGVGAAVLRDASFNFMFVDFQNPVAPAGTIPPVLSIAQSGANVVVSWSNGSGFTLQKTSSLASPVAWADVGTANPSAPIPITGTSQYFRVRQ